MDEFNRALNSVTEDLKSEADEQPDQVLRSQIIDKFYELGYSLGSEEERDGKRVLHFRSTGTKVSPDIEVKILSGMSRYKRPGPSRS